MELKKASVMLAMVALQMLTCSSVMWKSKEVALRKQEQSTGSVLSEAKVLSFVQCIAICLNTHGCFIFNVIKTGDVINCVLIQTIQSIISNPNSDTFIDTDGYHLFNNYFYWNGDWFAGTTTVMNYSQAISYCSGRKSTIFIAKTAAENAFIVEFMIDGGIYYMWYPVNDIVTDGVMMWEDGTSVTTSDPIPWSGGTYGYGNDDYSDCAQINQGGGVVFYSCGLVDAGVMCLSDLF